jgi:lipopolysaccharide export system protein LptC
MTDPRQDRFENLVVGADARVLNPAYSKIVRWLRLVLPLVAVAIVVMLFTWTLLDESTQIAEKPKGKGMDQAENELVAAKFESRDSNGNPFTLTAARALQGQPKEGQDEKIIYLEKPSGEMLLEQGRTITLSAVQGEYDQGRQALRLEGGVRLSTGDGYEVDTDKVLVNIKDSRADSSAPVTGHGPAGTIEALGFSADNEQGRLILKGPARLVIKPEAL